MKLLGMALVLWGLAVVLVAGWECVTDQLECWLERHYDDPLTPALWAAGCMRRVK